MSKKKPLNPKEIRLDLRLNQSEFWSRIGVTQSGGSRYESGRTMPKPVQTLLVLAYGNKPFEELAKLRGTNPSVVGSILASDVNGALKVSRKV
jgi:transcriptional regulator with XRE-family HTH domain